MPRRKVEFAVGEYYHVYNRGVRRQPIFFERENYLFFLRRLREQLPKEHVEITAYCLMPNHYHSLVRLCSPVFSDRMQAFVTSYSKAINKRHGLSGALFESRFQAKHVDASGYLLLLTRYIHRNPLVAGLVKSPLDWEFSSYPEYPGRRAGTLPNPEIILREMLEHSEGSEGLEARHFGNAGLLDGPQLQACRDAYRKYVEASTEPTVSIEHLMFE